MTVQLCINCGYNSAELSDWAVAAVYVYNRELNDSEIVSVERHLSSVFGVPLALPCEFVSWWCKGVMATVQTDCMLACRCLATASGWERVASALFF